MINDPIFFDGFDGLLRTICAAVFLYVAVVVAVRIFGKRSTSQMNNFDWIVTVGIGSLMASGVMLEDVTVIESVAAIYVLLGLQWALTRSMLSSDEVTKAIKSEPTLLLHRGEVIEAAMKRERLTMAELHAAVRGAGLSRIEDVQWVILETNSSLSVIPNTQPLDDPSVLRHVAGAEQLVQQEPG
ncbi:Membrane protein-like protein [Sulfitobacter noctilucae]|uniref:DUF421 domain-containing protein n=1 Tax=Sulfitobacter noctilucae TaxID=1342302 RepID=UPI0009DF7BA5|nr:YetF domain-containing protein [Sulfitobacter noctilucae]KIN65850.1 Membrane protein-like protein [Sulfitobacter noctilucae]